MKKTMGEMTKKDNSTKKESSSKRPRSVKDIEQDLAMVERAKRQVRAININDEDIRDTKKFVEALQSIPDKEYESGRLLIMGFMSGIEE